MEIRILSGTGTNLQAHFIEAQADLRERKQTSLQGGYEAKKLVGIKETFDHLAPVTSGDRSAVTNLTDTNKNLATKVAKQANHRATKDAAMETMKKLIH